MNKGLIPYKIGRINTKKLYEKPTKPHKSVTLLFLF